MWYPPPPKPIGEVHVVAKPVGVLTTISVKTPKPIGEVDTAAKPVGVLTAIPVNSSHVTSLNGSMVEALWYIFDLISMAP